MLDKRTAALLNTVNAQCSSGGYKIFSEEDFLSCFEPEWGVTGENLLHMLDHLSENGYINVKYAAGGMYCVMPLPLGRSYSEREAEKKSEDLKSLKYFAYAAFFGGLIGGGIGSLIMLVLFLLLR